MMSDHFVFAVVQVGIGSFEGPTEFAIRRGLAGIDLRAGRVSVDDDVQSGWHLNCIRNVGRGLFGRSRLSVSKRTRCDHDSEDKCASGQKSFHEHRL